MVVEAVQKLKKDGIIRGRQKHSNVDRRKAKNWCRNVYDSLGDMITTTLLCRNCLLKKFTRLTGKHKYQSFFLIKLQALGLQLYLKKRF